MFIRDWKIHLLHGKNSHWIKKATLNVCIKSLKDMITNGELEARVKCT